MKPVALVEFVVRILPPANPENETMERALVLVRPELESTLARLVEYAYLAGIPGLEGFTVEVDEGGS